jgi:hypothetical protein
MKLVAVKGIAQFHSRRSLGSLYDGKLLSPRSYSIERHDGSLALLTWDAVHHLCLVLAAGSSMKRTCASLVVVLVITLSGAVTARLAAWQDELGFLHAHLRSLKQACGNGTGK